MPGGRGVPGLRASPLPLRDNVRLGDPAFEGTDADVLAALEAVGALDLLDVLPQGLGTPLSRAFTGGHDLSGGQWQKVALARAVYALNAGRHRALIVDEPTAHLDARAEREVFERLLDGTRGAPWCSSRTASPPSGGPTGSWSWRAGRSPSRAVTPS
ncbi:hypothetical protein ACFQ0B_61140 [Nonomuraea thailandensis]